MAKLADYQVREVRKFYAEHQAAKEANLVPALTIKDIGKLFDVHWTTVIRIGRREQRYDVSDAPDREDEARLPKQPHPRTKKRRAGRK